MNLILRCALATSRVNCTHASDVGLSGAAEITSEIRGNEIRFGIHVLAVTPDTGESTTSRGDRPGAITKLSLPIAT